jgi:hypothetical protein
VWPKNTFAVYQHTVGTVQVLNGNFASLSLQNGMVAGYLGIIQNDVVVGRAAHCQAVAQKRVAFAGQGAGMNLNP